MIREKMTADVDSLTQDEVAYVLAQDVNGEIEVGDLYREQLYSKLYDSIYKMVFSIAGKYVTNSNDDIEDLANDCMLKIVRCLGSFDLNKGKLTTWCWRVCTSVLNKKYRKDEKKLEQYVPGGFPVLMGPTSLFGKELVEANIQLKKGDKVVLFTDGVNEAMDKDYNEFGIEKLRDIIKETGDAGAQEMLDAIIRGVSDFVGNAEQSDDIALLVIEKT